MSLLDTLEQKIQARVRKRLGLGDGKPWPRWKQPEFDRELQQSYEVIGDLLVRLLDTVEPATPSGHVEAPAPRPPEAAGVSVPGAKEHPTPEILDRARKLQALAIGSPEEHERAAAWTAFEKLWQRYHLPTNLGMEIT